MIELKEASCSFSDGFGGKGLFTAVSPLSAHFSDGGRYAIVGESGSGKTTLARMIAGLQRPSGGSVFVDGEPIYGRKRAGNCLLYTSTAGNGNRAANLGSGLSTSSYQFGTDKKTPVFRWTFPYHQIQTRNRPYFQRVLLGGRAYPGSVLLDQGHRVTAVFKSPGWQRSLPTATVFCGHLQTDTGGLPVPVSYTHLVPA